MPEETVNHAAHLLGKRSLERFGLNTLQEKMRKVGKKATGRPRPRGWEQELKEK
jgi:hypothetical protein